MQTSTREDFWTQHLEAWHDGGLSQNAYCREHNLRPNQFSYWKHKLASPKVNDRSAVGEPSSTFVPLHINPGTVTGKGLHLLLPNGCELAGIESEHLPLVIGLMEALR